MARKKKNNLDKTFDPGVAIYTADAFRDMAKPFMALVYKPNINRPPEFLSGRMGGVRGLCDEHITCGRAISKVDMDLFSKRASAEPQDMGDL